jgi:hypothetical protein
VAIESTVVPQTSIWHDKLGTLPAKLFEGNPETIKLEWIDFYRN